MTSDRDAADARFIRVVLVIAAGVALVVGLVLGVSYFQDQARDDCQVGRMMDDMTGGDALSC